MCNLLPFMIIYWNKVLATFLQFLNASAVCYVWDMRTFIKVIREIMCQLRKKCRIRFMKCYGDMLN